ncbi:MAG: polysaccharide deacetylase [Phenylobacterium sp.]|nr:polysaccharide deacetylase [Phenylobacterium sp.]
MADLIFHDPTGRRARRVRLVGGLVASFVALMVAGFFATLAFAPRLPGLTLKDPQVLSALHQETAHKLKGRQQWNRIPHPRSAAAAGGQARPLAVGFYVSWDESSRESLADHIDQLDVVSPQWIALAGADGTLSITSDPQARAIIASAKRPPSILPGVFNYNTAGHAWNGPQADAVLFNPAARVGLINNLVAQAQKRGYAGYVFDFEDLSPAGARAYPGFIAQARAALKPIGREVWVTTPFADDDFPIKALQEVSDAVVLMAYDQHWGGGEPGPAAAQDWFETTLAKRMEALDPAKTVLALGAYGYDWTLKGPKNRRRPRPSCSTRRPRRRTTPRRRPRWTRPRSTRPSATRTTWAASTASGSSTPRPCSTRSRSPTASAPWAMRSGGWAARTSSTGRCCATTTARPSPTGWRC